MTIELIIKIPIEQYKIIKSCLHDTFPSEMKKWGLEVIKNGKPLGVPIENKQSKIGRWIKKGDGFAPYACSECENVEFKQSNFCPTCGAKMVEPQESEERNESCKC